MANNRQENSVFTYGFGRTITITLGFAALAFVASGAFGANAWDAGGGSQYWYNPTNWSVDLLPPNNSSNAVTDTQINIGTAALPGGEGVLYDPSANDPGFSAAQSAVFPAGYGPQSINALYISRFQTGGAAPLPDNLLTIKGDLTMQATVIIGRSSGSDGMFTNGKVVQTAGTVTVPNSTMDLAGADTTQAGLGNGTYDYRGGTLEVSQTGGSGLRLSSGSNTVNGITAAVTGASGVGKFIMHNPATGGHVRPYTMTFASYAGAAANPVNRNPNGVTTGVGIAEFHYENGNTRPIQVSNNLSLNNGVDPTTTATRSARIDLKLDAAPTLTAGVPQNLGLFDVDFDQTDLAVGAITGTGSLSKTFNSADGSVNYAEGSTVSATFGSTTYNWKISYTGNITWTDAANSVVNAIAGPGTGIDVVLMGLSSVSNGVPGDYNNNGIVDAADYAVWRTNSGQSVTIPNDPTPGTVTQADYDFWKAHFGATSGAGAGLSSGGAVPEPSTLALAAFGLIGAGVIRRRRA